MVHILQNKKKKKTSFQIASIWAHREQEPIDDQLNAQEKYRIVRNFVWLRKNGSFYITLFSSGMETKVMGKRGINIERIC